MIALLYVAWQPEQRVLSTSVQRNGKNIEIKLKLNPFLSLLFLSVCLHGWVGRSCLLTHTIAPHTHARARTHTHVRWWLTDIYRTSLKKKHPFPFLNIPLSGLIPRLHANYDSALRHANTDLPIRRKYARLCTQSQLFLVVREYKD